MTFVADRRGIDATVALAATLGELSRSSQIAADAPNGRGLYRYLSVGLPVRSLRVRGAGRRALLALVRVVASGLLRGHADHHPVVCPRSVVPLRPGSRELGCAARGRLSAGRQLDHQEAPLSSPVVGPPDHLYTGHRPWRGFTACHIWRDLRDSRIAGEDPWLYSFVPNLVWLPSGLAPLTDRHGSWCSAFSSERHADFFSRTQSPRRSCGMPSTPGRSCRCPPMATRWRSIGSRCSWPTQSSSTRRVAYLEKFVAGCDDVLAGRQVTKKVVSSRYAPGLRRLDPAVVAAFRTRIGDYGRRVRSAATQGALPT